MRLMKQWAPVISVVSLLALPAVALSSSAAEGKKHFDAKKCISCHSLGNEAGKLSKLGGPLDGIGSKHDAAWLKSFIKNPKAAKEASKMPKVALTDAELDDIVEYLLSVK